MRRLKNYLLIVCISLIVIFGFPVTIYIEDIPKIFIYLYLALCVFAIIIVLLFCVKCAYKGLSQDIDLSKYEEEFESTDMYRNKVKFKEQIEDVDI